MCEIVLLSLPIGNLGDLTKRVLGALSGPGLFIVEDTRSFRSLLTHLGCSFEGKEILSYHDQSTQVSCEYVLKK
ncbi:MAG: 16S rRNA (cytidine(1402)-2'-O)-methyltransferase, partial [Bdellovibrionota bacterium]